ncbi:MAG: pilus assembly protein [Chloroflexi bacterium]|nr:pilus assembly protein [Chloroflexota bacterium]
MEPLIVFNGERAQGLVEYALVLLFIALAVIVTLTLLGGSLVNGFYNIIIASI